MNQEVDRLAKLSADLMNAAPAGYRELLAKRGDLLVQLAARQAPLLRAEELASALRAGGDARSKLIAELGSLRAQIDDLQRLRAGLTQLRPIQAAASPSLDVLL